MRKIWKITRVAVKRAFKKLRNQEKLFCNALNNDILVTKLYLNHINWNAKKRDLKEVILRLLTVILVEEILEKWILEENRNDEKKFEFYDFEKNDKNFKNF